MKYGSTKKLLRVHIIRGFVYIYVKIKIRYLSAQKIKFMLVNLAYDVMLFLCNYIYLECVSFDMNK